MENNYLLYKNISISDSQKPKYHFSKDESSCVNMCLSENNCQGIMITNPVCKNEHLLNKCVEENLKNGIGDNINNISSENLSKYNCKLLTNINNTDYILNSDNNTTYIKKKYINKINNISLNKQYYLKINNFYIGISNQNNQIFLIPVKNVINASMFKFNLDGNIIESKSGKCIQVNGNYLILENCLQDNLEQQFIYESKSNTIRPQINIFDNNNGNQCISISLDNSDKIILEECNYKNNINQEIITKLGQNLTKSNSNLEENSNSEKNLNLEENFESSGDIGNLKKVNFCSNAIYKTIITLILTCILIYFIWYLCKKQYKDNNEF